MICQSRLRRSAARAVVRAAIALILSHGATLALAQRAPVSPDHPWHGLGETRVEANARNFAEPGLNFDPEKAYSLPELIDLAESHNPETRIAWERARAQVAALGVARSELYPTVAAAALAGVDRDQVYLADRFFRQTIGAFEVALNLNYTIFDFGARAGRISAAKAEALAANFAFNDTHREVIYRVEQAYYQVRVPCAPRTGSQSLRCTRAATADCNSTRSLSFPASAGRENSDLPADRHVKPRLPVHGCEVPGRRI